MLPLSTLREQAWAAYAVSDEAVADLLHDDLLDESRRRRLRTRTATFVARTGSLCIRVRVRVRGDRLNAEVRVDPPAPYAITARSAVGSLSVAIADAGGRARIDGLPRGLLSFAVDATPVQRTAWLIY